jgi:hypothetical protein
MLKEMKEPQPLWTRLLALSGALVMVGAALAFPRLEQRPAGAAAVAVSRLRLGAYPNRSEVAWLFRSYAKVTPAPRRFLMTGPLLLEKPLG